jgi:hypothetical protein
MKISRTKAIFLLFFWPSRLIQKTEDYYKKINTPEAIAEKQRKNNEIPQSKRSIYSIRKALFWSFVLVMLSVISALIVGKIYYLCGGVRHQFLEEILQYSGIGILLWATLGKVGWDIQTMDGDTIPELVNEWVFRFQYVVGSFILVLSVSLTFGS